MNNRKSHRRFWLVPKSTTLDVIEGPLCTLFQNTCVFRSPPRKFEWRLTMPSATKCGKRSSEPWSAEYLESAEKLRIYRRRYIVETLTNKANIIIWYYSYLLPLHWLQNTWPWMTLNGHFTLNFHCYESPLRIYFYILTVEFVYITWPAEMCGSGLWSEEYLGSSERLRIFRRRYIVGTTNKAKISI